LLFAVNPTAQTVSTTLNFTGERTLTPAWQGVPALEGNASASVDIPAYTVYIWELAHD
jgi:hypothetical protein